MNDLPLVYLLLPPAGYLIGATPFGVLLARSRGVDLRAVGSGNVGATNVGRALGAKWGYVCFLLDVAKGLLPTLAAGWLLRGDEFGVAIPRPPLAAQGVWLGVGLGCILGHVFSFYLRGRGGKGVATGLGVVLGVFPYFTWPGLVALGLWIVVTLASRYVSLGSVTAAAGFVPLFLAFNWPAGQLWPLAAFAVAMAALILLRHRTNIVRLWKGTENKIGRGGKGGRA